MKKITLLIVAFILCAGAVNAQETLVGVKVGYNLSTISVKSDNALGMDNNRMLSSFNIGFIMDVPMGGEMFSFQPALTLSGKGSRTDVNTQLFDLTITHNPFYINLQTNVTFNIPLSGDLRIFAGIGPYVSVGIFGQTTIKATVLGKEGTAQYDINFTSNKTDISLDKMEGFANMKRYDFGGNIVAGVMLGRFMVSANYEHGLVSVFSGTSDNEDSFGKNRTLSLSVGMFF